MVPGSQPTGATFRDAWPAMRDVGILYYVIWACFSGAVVLTIAPVILCFGFNPTLDQLLETAICGGPIR